MRRLRERRQRGAEELAFEIVQNHAYELLRFARRFSLCDDDAQDAYQRALEILIRHLRGDNPPHNTLAWLRTVVRHEAYRVREEREQRLAREPYDLERERAAPEEDPAERVERFERLEVVGEALRRLKPQEVTALVLRAEGLSYREICERTSWTYTRCNRCVTEGRRALRERMREIESGRECARWTPVLSRLADGEATARELADLRPHLRGCAACRATLRSFREAPQQVGALVPLAVLPPVAFAGEGTIGGLVRSAETLVGSVLERLTSSAVRAHAAVEALSGAKVAAVAASTVAVAGGGVALERAASDRAARSAAEPAHAQVVAHAPSTSTTAAATTSPAGGPSTSVRTDDVDAAAASQGEWALVGGAEFGLEPVLMPPAPSDGVAPVAPAEYVRNASGAAPGAVASTRDEPRRRADREAGPVRGEGAGTPEFAGNATPGTGPRTGTRPAAGAAGGASRDAGAPSPSVPDRPAPPVVAPRRAGPSAPPPPEFAGF